MSQTAASSLDGRHSHNSLAGLLSPLHRPHQGSCKEFPSHRVTLRPFPFVRIVGAYQRIERASCGFPESLAGKAFCIIMLETDFSQLKNKRTNKPFRLIACHFLGASPRKSCEKDLVWMWTWTWTWTRKASVVPFVRVRFYPAGINDLGSNANPRSSERVRNEEMISWIHDLLHLHHQPRKKEKRDFIHVFPGGLFPCYLTILCMRTVTILR